MLGALGRDHFAGTRAAEVLAAGVLSATAGSSPDGVEQNGLVLDRQVLEALGAQSVAFILAGRASIGASENLVFSANWQEADDAGFSSGVQDADTSQAESISALEIVAGAVTDAKIYACLPLNLLLGEKRYQRIQFTLNASRAGTDTWLASPLYLIGNEHETPVARAGLSRV